MKLSLRSLITNVWRLSAHYPLLVLTTMILMVFGLDMVRDRGLITDIISSDKRGALIYLLIISIIIGLGIYGKKEKWNRICHLLVILGLAVWRYVLPTDFATTHGIMMGVIGIASISRVIRGALPHGSRSLTNIHHRTGHIIQQIALGFIFSVILAGGLSLALVAIQALFGVSIDSERYGSIRTIISVIVGVMTTLDGILFDTMDATTPTKWKTTLARVVSILILVFGVILYVYLAMILITRSRPSNEVSRRGFVFVGLVLAGTILLIPLLDYTEKKKQTIHTTAHLIIIPILITIGIAIYQRVAQYGITEMRYLTIALLLIIGGTSIWHLLTRRSSPYPLLVAISVAGLLAIFGGPISARSIAYQSQYTRLTNYLTDQNLLTGEQLTLPLSTTDDQKHTMREFLTYFADGNGRGLPQLHPDLADHKTLFETTQISQYSSYVETEREQTHKTFYYRNNNIIDITGYNTLHKDIGYHNTNGFSLTINQDTVSYTQNEKNIATFETRNLINKLSTKDPSQEPIEKIILTTENAAFIVNNISIEKGDDSRIIQGINGTILLK